MLSAAQPKIMAAGGWQGPGSAIEQERSGVWGPVIDLRSRPSMCDNCDSMCLTRAKRCVSEGLPSRPLGSTAATLDLGNP